MLIPEGPALCHPHGIGVTGRNRAIYRFAVLGQQPVLPGFVTLGDRQSHLIETIRQIVGVLAELLFPLLDKHLSYLAEIRRIGRQYIGIVFFIKSTPLQMLEANLGVFLGKSHRDKPGKRGSHGLHAQLAHAFQYLVLQFYLGLLPPLRQRSVPAVEVAHAMPGQMGRPGEKGSYLLFLQPHLQPHALGYRLAGHGSQRHVHAPQRHPVNLLFPAIPIPIGCGVSKRTHVQEITELIGGGLSLQGIVGPYGRQGHVLPTPRLHRLASLTQVGVEGITEGNRAAASQGENSLPSLDLEGLFSVFGGDNLQLYL